MQAALLKPLAQPEPLAVIDTLPVARLDAGFLDGATHVAVTLSLSPGVAAGTGEPVPHREILMRIDLPGDASVHGAGLDIIERQFWVDELQGGCFEHITCRVRHESVTREIDLAWVMRSLREQGLVADGDLLESVQVST